MTELEQIIEKTIAKPDVTLISYIDGEGYPITKAMLEPRMREGIKTFFLTTNTSSNKVRFLRRNPKASLYFVDRQCFHGVSLSGMAEILETREAKEAIWRPGDTLYYKKGVTDPDYCVLKFTAVKGRYYSDFHSEDFEL